MHKIVILVLGVICSLIFTLSIPQAVYALDIIGTGRDQSEALNNALRNLSELMSGVHVNSSFQMDKQLSGGHVTTTVQDMISSNSEFYVEDVQKYVTQLSENRIVFSVSQKDLSVLREKYMLWKRRADVRGSLKVNGDRLVVSLKEVNGVPVTLHSYQMQLDTTKTSFLCTDWKESESETISGILDKAVVLGKSENESKFELSLDTGFNLLDIGKQKDIKASLVIHGLDGLGRAVRVEI